MPQLRELTVGYVESADFDRLLVNAVRTTFPAHEHEGIVVRGALPSLLSAWAADQRTAVCVP